MPTIQQDKIRNIAIIAHVDHGKTTLVDGFIKQSHLFRDNEIEMQQEQILDSNALEREKGITILAKNISIPYRDYKINIIDTPGHADFGGEVERTLNMADGCVLVVDAQEGPMPQTEFVLKKAFESKLRVIVVINKIDKKYANVAKVTNRIYDLFLKMATDEKQLDFPILYAIAREGMIFTQLPEGDLTDTSRLTGTLEPLLDKVVQFFDPPVGEQNEPFQMQICSLDYDAHLGRLLIGKIKRGTVKIGDKLVVADKDKTYERGEVRKLYLKDGLKYAETDSAICGDIVAIAGVESTGIGRTLCISSHIEALEDIKISPPSVKIKIEPNTSPLAGKEGEYVTAKQIEQRMEREKQLNIGLIIDKSDGGSYDVSGRGELQLSILIETMRREGYEFQVRRPEVILQKREDGIYEPLEKLFIDIPEQYVGTVTSSVSQRSAELVDMQTENGMTRFEYKIRTRKLLGLRNQLLTLTKGTAIINSYLEEYIIYENLDELERNGVLIASEAGVSMGYSLNTAQERGELFIGPGLDVYEGMIVGVNKYEEDIDINVCKARHQSAVRMKHDEITQTQLKPTIPLTLEYALVFINDDEMLEVTPKNLRLRKVLLNKVHRVWSKRKNLSPLAKMELGL